VFKNSCEVTMKVMRQECEALICVLKTFIHDPLVEWEKVKGKPSSTDTTNEKVSCVIMYSMCDLCTVT
jgi:serine/threonine-protein kinase ATR